MSVNALEKALWQVYVNGDDTQRFRSDPGAFLDGFELDENERAMVLSWDVMGEIRHGANPLLVMMAWQTIFGVQNLQDYFALVNGPQAA